jgi:hypothetical protein
MGVGMASWERTAAVNVRRNGTGRHEDELARAILLQTPRRSRAEIRLAKPHVTDENAIMIPAQSSRPVRRHSSVKAALRVQ